MYKLISNAMIENSHIILQARKARKGFIKRDIATNSSRTMPSAKKKRQQRQQTRLGSLNPSTMNTCFVAPNPNATTSVDSDCLLRKGGSALVGRYLGWSTRAMAEGMREGSVRLLREWQQRWRRGRPVTAVGRIRD